MSPVLLTESVSLLPADAESAAWQRILFFRAWYDGAEIVDVSADAGIASAYAQSFASSVRRWEPSNDRPATGFPLSTEPWRTSLSEADLILAFGTLDEVDDPEAVLNALSNCTGRIIFSANIAPALLESLMTRTFPDRLVRLLSHTETWPGTLTEGGHNARLDGTCVAVVGGGPLPTWPSLGITIPSCANADGLEQSILELSQFYPGPSEFVVVANRADESTIERYRSLTNALADRVTLVESDTNLGFGGGANRGLQVLHARGHDLYAVAHDDIVPAADCVCQMVVAVQELLAQGVKPGMIGPVSNLVDGPQRVEIGAYDTAAEMRDAAQTYHRTHHSSASQSVQVRAVFSIITPECLESVGGFDPLFGIGRFEDDDYNLRARLAGFSLWIADGAFLHHTGAATFAALGFDRDQNMVRNLAIFLEKWGLDSAEAAWAVDDAPLYTPLYVPFDAEAPTSEHVITINGELVDLVHQASEFDLAAWIVTCLRDHPRECRISVLDALQNAIA